MHHTRQTKRVAKQHASRGAAKLPLAMGKLAERFTDVNRSGVYRVGAAGVPRAAAMEARAHLIEMPASALCDAVWRQLQRVLDHRQDTGACVLLVSDAAAPDAWAHERMVAALRATAEARRDTGRAFFAVLVDPEARLALPPLYREPPGPARE